MYHLLKHINQDITRRLSKDKDSTVNKTEYWRKGNHEKNHYVNNEHPSSNLKEQLKPNFKFI